MLTIDPAARSLQAVPPTTLTDEQILERYGLQACIEANPQTFFDEIGEDLLLIDSETSSSPHIERRIDLLAIDRDGAVVIIELKRDKHPLQMLQCLSYAALISDWGLDRFVAARAQSAGVSESEARAQITGFLYGEPDALNRNQRVILIAEGYDYDLLATGQWLTETYGLDIRCVQVAANTLDGTTLLACHRVLPPQQLTDHAVGRRRRRAAQPNPSTWAEAIGAMQDDTQVAFFRRWVDRGQEGETGRSILFFRHGETRMWWVRARSSYSYAWQYERFPGDLKHWQAKLSDPDSVREINGGASLRFTLRTPGDYDAFEQTVTADSLPQG